MKKSGDPKSVGARDKAIARRLKTYRLAANVGQVALAERIGVTFQQVQKYEGGINRVSAGRLQQIAEALDVPIVKFFEG